MIFPGTLANFKTYIKQAGRFVLYSNEEDKFTENHRRRLSAHNVNEVYIEAGQREHFRKYVRNNLGSILLREELPLEQRAAIFHQASIAVVKDLFHDSHLDSVLTQSQLDRVVELVRQATSFLNGEASLKRLGALISHDYKTYSHSLHVFVYSSVIFQTYEVRQEEVVDVGIGAVLHDLGKKTIPHEVLFKAGALTPEERSLVNSHPVKGVAMCSHLSLSKLVTDCILFHHEKMDGTGYPTGLVAEDIPLPVRILAVCDVYDALTTNRPYSKARTPFESLRLMHNSMRTQLDRDVLKRLILILSGASLV